MDASDLIYDNIKLSLDGRQESAIRRFTSCDVWGILLLHKVGTGKTITSLLIALNTFRTKKIESSATTPVTITVIAPVGIYAGFIKDLITYILYYQTAANRNDVLNRCKANGGESEVFKFFDVYFKLKNYSFDALLTDLNNKKAIKYDGNVVIIDEAHRLLTDDVYNSTEASGTMKKHPLIDDLIFNESISHAIRLITMSGTPMQKTPADLCKFGNFITKSTEFSSEKYAKKIANLVWAAFVIKQIGTIQSVANGLMSMWYSPLPIAMGVGVAASAVGVAAGTVTLVTAAPAIATSILLGVGLNMALAAGAKYYVKRQLKAEDIYVQGITDRGGKKTQRFKIPKTNSRKRIQTGGTAPDFVVKTMSWLITNIQPHVADKIKSIELSVIDSISKNALPGLVTGVTDLVAYSPLTEEGKQILSVIEEPVFNLSMLAKNLSPNISIYDYLLQNTINLACVKEINEIFNEISPNNNINFADKDFSKMHEFSYETSLNGLVKINKIKNLNNISQIKTNNPECNAIIDPVTTNNYVNTRFPKKIQVINFLFFDDVQKELIRKYCINLLTDAEKSIFYLNKYEKVSIEYRDRLTYFVNNMKYVSNYSIDLLNYYSYIDADASYNKYSYKLRTDVVADAQKSGIFACEKFKHALNLIKTINNGSLPDGDNVHKHPHGKDGGSDLVQDDEKTNGYYLPVVYSYNEDYGLGLFANYLESMGQKYILISKLQENVTGAEYVGTLLEHNKSKAFDNTYDSPDDPICVLIDPTMTEGLNAKFNPAILILEACNTFGDSEQVEGRVLRKYAKPYPTQKQKIIYQYITAEDNPDNSGKNFLKNTYNKHKNKLPTLLSTISRQVELENVIAFSVKEYVQVINAFNYISPDRVCFDKIQREEKNLKKFEENVRSGIEYADLNETLLCKSENMVADEFMINLNSNNSTDEKLYLDCKSAENQDIVLKLIDRIKVMPLNKQNILQLKLATMFQQLDSEYEEAYNRLVKAYNYRKIKMDKGEHNLDAGEQLDKPLDLDAYARLFKDIFIETDSTGNTIISRFISTRIINIEAEIMNERTWTSMLQRNNRQIYTAQLDEFNHYIDSRIAEFDTIKGQLQEPESIKRSYFQTDPLTKQTELVNDLTKKLDNISSELLQANKKQRNSLNDRQVAINKQLTDAKLAIAEINANNPLKAGAKYTKKNHANVRGIFTKKR
jgi:hypothetical protein